MKAKTQIAMGTIVALLISFSTLVGCDDATQGNQAGNDHNDASANGEEVYDDSNDYYQGDTFSLYKLEGEDKGAELQYYVNRTSIMTSSTYDDYMFVEVDITNKSDREQTIAVPDFYADDYLITDENPAIPEDATPPNTSIKSGKKVTARFYQYINHPYEHKKLEANFGNVSVVIVGGNLVFTNDNGEVFYENGKQVGDPYGICGHFLGKEYYGDSLNGRALNVEYSSPGVYHIVIKMEDGSTVEGDAEYKVIDGQAGLHLRKEHLYSLFYHPDEKQYNVFYQSATWRFDKVSEEEYNKTQNTASNGTNSEYDDLMDTIMIYYAQANGTNDIDAEVSSEDSDSVTFRLFDPNANTTSDTLGFYCYNKKTDSWTDAITGKPVDFDEASDDFNEMLDARSGNYEYIIPYSSERELTESDLSGLIAQELTYARNEIYARHGYIFKSQELNDYFGGKSWYHPDQSFDGTFNSVEKKNIEFINDYQKKTGLTYKPE